MKRRMALAFALLFTTIAGFFVVAYVLEGGLLGGDTAAPQVTESGAQTAGPAAPTPQVIEQYVYRDEVVQAPGSDSDGSSGGANDAGGGGGPGGTTSPDNPPGSTPQPGGPATPTGETREEGLNGYVVAVGNGTFTLTGTHVGDAAISVTSRTEYSSALSSSFSLSQIAAGQFLRVKVRVAEGNLPTGPSGSWQATSIREDLLTEALNGNVTSVGPATFTLSGTKWGEVTMSVTGTTKYESEIDGSLTFGEIQPGMYLKTKVILGPGDAPTGPNGTWVAVNVKEATP